MIEKNKHYEVEIRDISSDGNGVGIIDGFTVFVPMSAIGDVAEIVVVKVLSHYAVGRIVRLISESYARTEPMCPVFKRCGGCHLQHIKYEKQLEIKKNFIESALSRIGGFEGFECEEVLGMETPERYRNKCIFPIGKGTNSEVVSGFYARRSHEIIPVNDCMVGAEINKDILSAVKEYIDKFNVSVYDENNHSGLVRRVFIRQANSSGEIMVIISINGTELPQKDSFVNMLTRISDKITSIYVNINKKITNVVLGEKNKLIFGKEVIEDTLCGISFRISPHSFYQINPHMTEKLYLKALEMANITEEDTVLDVYCGIGTISLAAAKNAKFVNGVEIVEQAVCNARENAVNNGIENVRFFADSAENAVPKLIENGETPDVVILDPPRKGSDEQTLKAIVSAAPKRIVYVSCNPATLARDAKLLKELGYMPTRCVGVDMFPHTTHIESCMLLCRENES